MANLKIYLKIYILLLECLLYSAKANPIQISQKTIDHETEQNDEMETAFDLILKANTGSHQNLVDGDIAMKRSRSAISCATIRCAWPQSSDGIVQIPYVISSAFERRHRDLIQESLNEIETLTCIDFVERKKEKDYLNIVSGSGCTSFTGRIGGAQTISVSKFNCMWKGVIQHEVKHALGFIHEHSRSDRDNYVKIMWQYITPRHRGNFRINLYSNNLGLDYDYASIMHYGRRSFSNTPGEASIIPIPDESITLGQTNGLSNLDVAKINKLYNCNRCSAVLVASDGSLTSANYPSNYSNAVNCLWLIRLQRPIEKVSLTFEVFDLQPSMGCTADYVKVYDGISKSDKVLLDNTCGATIPPSVTSSKNMMLVEFVSDGRVAGIGFKASYTTVRYQVQRNPRT